MQPIFLIRHAPVQLDLAVPSEHWQLSPEGLALAERLAALPILANLQMVWTSPEPKAQATARPLAHRHAAALLVHPNLAELSRGPTNLPDQKAYLAAVRQAFDQPTTSTGGWERAADAQQRIVGCMHALAAQTTGPIAAVSHGLVLALLMAHLRRQPWVDFAEWQALPLPALAIINWNTQQIVEPFRSVEAWERAS